MKSLFAKSLVYIMFCTGGLTSAHAAATQDVVDTAVAAGQFGTLVAAIKAAGLEQTLRNAPLVTVFAPTDAAFAKLPAGTLANLLANPLALRQLLLSHVVLSAALTVSDIEGAVEPLDVSNGIYSQGDFYLKMANGKQRLTCSDHKSPSGYYGGYLCVSGLIPAKYEGEVNYVARDVMASNGIIQVIDTVLDGN